MPPLISNSGRSSDDDDSSFATVPQDFFEDELPTHPLIEACNITKLKITTLVEGSQSHSWYINQVKLRSRKQIFSWGPIANQQVDAMKKQL